MKPDQAWFDVLPPDRLLAEFSLWSADLGRLCDDMTRVDKFVDLYHIDVADGHFSPALLFFPDLVGAARKVTTKPFHVHLMCKDDILDDQIKQFAGLHVERSGGGVDPRDVRRRFGRQSHIEHISEVDERLGLDVDRGDFWFFGQETGDVVVVRGLHRACVVPVQKAELDLARIRCIRRRWRRSGTCRREQPDTQSCAEH